MNQVADIRNWLVRLLKSIEFATGQKQIPDGRRCTWRYEWNSGATVRYMNSYGSFEELHVLTSHISPLGLDFLCSGELESGQKVVISLDTEDGGLEIPATVLHCTTSVGRNIIGVNFDLDQSDPPSSECE